MLLCACACMEHVAVWNAAWREQHAFSGLSVRSFSLTSVIHIKRFLFFFLSSAFDLAGVCVNRGEAFFCFSIISQPSCAYFSPFFFSITMIWVYSGEGWGWGEKIEVDGLMGLLKAVLDSGRSVIRSRYFRAASTHRTFASHHFSSGTTSSSFAEEKIPVISSPHISALYIRGVYLFFWKQRLQRLEMLRRQRRLLHCWGALMLFIQFRFFTLCTLIHKRCQYSARVPFHSAPVFFQKGNASHSRGAPQERHKVFITQL